MIDVQAISSPYLRALYHPPEEAVGEERTVVAFGRRAPGAVPKACVFDPYGTLVFADSLPGFTLVVG
jgi:hypothetical protein